MWQPTTVPPAQPPALGSCRRLTPWTGYVLGFRAPARGFLFLQAHPRLWAFGVWPMLLNLVFSLIVFGALIVTTIHFEPRLRAWLGDNALGYGLEVLAWIGIVAVAGGVTTLMWILLQGLLCSYAFGLLARQVELRLGTPAAHFREVSYPAQALEVLRDVAVLAVVNLVLLLLQCIPVVGIVAGYFGLAFDAYVLGKEFLDFPLALRGWRRVDKVAFVRRYWAASTGLGTVMLACNLVPVLGALLLTPVAVGAVLLYHELARPAASPIPTPP